jgi:hypothetical protein
MGLKCFWNKNKIDINEKSFERIDILNSSLMLTNLSGFKTNLEFNFNKIKNEIKLKKLKINMG